MTREEAIKILKEIEFPVNGDNREHRDTAFDIAIKALEQEPVLDKIRAEIEQLDYNLESVDYDHNDMAMTEEVHMICQENVLQIIDKYRTESEV